jgi:hypothetical protein
LRVGSGECELRIEDHLIPPHHSQVLLDTKNQLVLVCTNAVYEIIARGYSVKKVVLSDGIVLQLGETELRVLVTPREKANAFDPLAPNEHTSPFLGNWEEKHQDAMAPFRPNKVDTPKSRLISELKHLINATAPAEFQSTFKLFKEPFKLRLETGPQADDEFVVSWGPRDFGPLALEYPIEYPPFPGILFSLTPNETGEILFSTKFPDFARVSGHNNPICVIRIGETIEAGNSTIVIENLKDSTKDVKS